MTCTHVCTANVTRLYVFFRFVVIAGDISPIDVISHVPVTCEDNSVPYVYVPSKVVRKMFQ